MKGKKKNVEQVAMDLYLNTNNTQKQICELLEITEKTFTKWKVEGAWDLLKGVQATTPNKILANLYKKMKVLTDNENASADDIIKLASAIEKIKPSKNTISTYINVFKELTTHILKRDIELAQKLNHFQKEFIDERIKSLQ